MQMLEKEVVDMRLPWKGAWRGRKESGKLHKRVAVTNFDEN